MNNLREKRQKNDYLDLPVSLYKHGNIILLFGL